MRMPLTSTSQETKCRGGRARERRTRRTLVAVMPMLAVCAGCAGPTDPPGSAHATHAMVGTYALRATLDVLHADVRRPEVAPTDASLTGTVVVGDTLENRGGGQLFFADVRYTGAFCASPTQCAVPESYASFTSLFMPQSAVTLGWASSGGITTLHFEGTFAGDSIAGSARYQVGMARYDGRFVARRQR